MEITLGEPTFFGPELIAGLVGAVIGAVVSGLISLLLQLYALKKAEEQRVAEATRTTNALNASIWVKVSNIRGTVEYFDKHFQGQINQVPRIEPERYIWEVKPLIGMPAPVTFTDQEVTHVFEVADMATFGNFMMLSMIHKTAIELTDLYAVKRAELLDQLPSTVFRGERRRIELTEPEMRKFGPKIIQLSSLLQELLQTLNKDKVFALNTRTMLRGPLKKPLLEEPVLPPTIPAGDVA